MSHSMIALLLTYVHTFFHSFLSFVRLPHTISSPLTLPPSPPLPPSIPPSLPHSRNQLDVVGDQLSDQQSRVARAHEAAGTDQLCAEKIAEQQLRIKQVRQTLGDILVYIRRCVRFLIRVCCMCTSKHAIKYVQLSMCLPIAQRYTCICTCTCTHV